MKLLIKNTYIVCNTILIQKIQKIPYFKLDLGMAFLDKNTNKLQLKDINMATHVSFHGRFIVKCGDIGSLPIYTDSLLHINTINICNNEYIKSYTIDNNIDIYTFINKILNSFFIEHNMIDKENITKPKEKEKKEEYIIPNKKFILS